MVINPKDYEKHFDTVLSHETIHAQQGHSFDLVLAEIVQIVLWFNLVLIYYKRSLRQIHEYLADDQTDTTDRQQYAQKLFGYVFQVEAIPLTNSFLDNLILKNRIKMLYQKRSSRWVLGRYLLALPLLGLLVTLVAARVAEPTQTVSERITVRGQVIGQKDTIPPSKEDEIFMVVEESPEFVGGSQALMQFLGRNIKYPAAAVQANVQGMVFVSFDVSKIGQTSNIKVLKGIGFGCDEEAVRVVSIMPKWKPGRQSGKPVVVRFNLPIKFLLEKSTERKTGATSEIEAVPKLTSPDIKIKADYLNDENITYYVEDEKITEAQMQKIKPDDIATVNVKKDEKGKNSTVIITLKKKKE